MVPCIQRMRLFSHIGRLFYKFYTVARVPMVETKLFFDGVTSSAFYSPILFIHRRLHGAKII